MSALTEALAVVLDPSGAASEINSLRAENERLTSELSAEREARGKDVAETIERCAKVADGMMEQNGQFLSALRRERTEMDRVQLREHYLAQSIAAAIRTLNPGDGREEVGT